MALNHLLVLAVSSEGCTACFLWSPMRVGACTVTSGGARWRLGPRSDVWGVHGEVGGLHGGVGGAHGEGGAGWARLGAEVGRATGEGGVSILGDGSLHLETAFA